MADAEDSKSSVGDHVRVQVPPSAPPKNKDFLQDVERCYQPVTASFDSHEPQKWPIFRLGYHSANPRTGPNPSPRQPRA